jgi:hypothetical protein
MVQFRTVGQTVLIPSKFSSYKMLRYRYIDLARKPVSYQKSSTEVTKAMIFTGAAIVLLLWNTISYTVVYGYFTSI